MSMDNPDFYLVPNEAIVLEYPLKCWTVKNFTYAKRGDYLLVHIEPSINYTDLQKRTIELKRMVLVARYQGKSLAKINECPVFVNIMWLANKDVELNTSKLLKLTDF